MTQDKYNRCCYCEKQMQTNDIFHFRRCLNTHGRWAHRICSMCWWSIVIPQSENIHFQCFGCVKKWPLWFFPKIKGTSSSVQIIEIE